MNSAMRPNFKEKFAEIVLVDPVNSAQDPQKKKMQIARNVLSKLSYNVL